MLAIDTPPLLRMRTIPKEWYDNWHYQNNIYDEATERHIDAVILGPTIQWIDTTQTALREHFAQNPLHQRLFRAERVIFNIDGLEPIHCLRLLTVYRVNPTPICTIFVGNEAYILEKRKKIGEFSDPLIAAGFVTFVRDSQGRPVRKITEKGLKATDEEVKAAVEAFCRKRLNRELRYGRARAQ